MSVDNNLFRDVLGSFATGVTVITAVDGTGQRRGMTASSVSSVSLDPPLVSCCVDHGADFHAAMNQAAHFGISILSADQSSISNQFASRKVKDKFEGVESETGVNGVPLISGAIATLVCEPYARFEAGDHTIFVGRAIAGECKPGEPLLHFRSNYTTTQPVDK